MAKKHNKRKHQSDSSEDEDASGSVKAPGAPGSSKSKPTSQKLKLNHLVKRVKFEGSFEKCFWSGPEPVSEPSEELKMVRKNLGIVIRNSAIGGFGAPPPLEDLTETSLPEWLRSYFDAKGYQHPTAVQKQAWPILLNGSNLLCVAPTGSGKTLAYVAPMRVHADARTVKGAVGLVLVPTRELAMQVAKVCEGAKMRTVVVCGGEDRDVQEDRLASGYQIIVATPGRLFDLLMRKTAKLENVGYLVLDEADRMMALGFEEQLQGIRQFIRPDAQAMMFSATFPGKLRSVVELWVPRAITLKVVERKPEEVQLQEDVLGGGGGEEESLQVVHSVKQTVHVCAEHKKPRKLLRFILGLRKEEKDEGRRNIGRILVFCNKIKTLKFVHDMLKKHKVERLGMIYGQMSQEDRNKALQDFKAGKITTLISTDVCARGIHIESLECVVNWDFPQNVEQYVHRVGRTGRQGAKGQAFTFFTRSRAPLAKELVQLLERSSQWVDPNLRELVGKPAMPDEEDAEIGVIESTKKEVI